MKNYPDREGAEQYNFKFLSYGVPPTGKIM